MNPIPLILALSISLISYSQLRSKREMNDLLNDIQALEQSTQSIKGKVERSNYDDEQKRYASSTNYNYDNFDDYNYQPSFSTNYRNYWDYSYYNDFFPNYFWYDYTPLTYTTTCYSPNRWSYNIYNTNPWIGAALFVSNIIWPWTNLFNSPYYYGVYSNTLYNCNAGWYRSNFYNTNWYARTYRPTSRYSTTRYYGANYESNPRRGTRYGKFYNANNQSIQGSGVAPTLKTMHYDRQHQNIESNKMTPIRNKVIVSKKLNTDRAVSKTKVAFSDRKDKSPISKTIDKRTYINVTKERQSNGMTPIRNSVNFSNPSVSKVNVSKKLNTNRAVSKTKVAFSDRKDFSYSSSPKKSNPNTWKYSNKHNTTNNRTYSSPSNRSGNSRRYSNQNNKINSYNKSNYKRSYSKAKVRSTTPKTTYSRPNRVYNTPKRYIPTNKSYTPRKNYNAGRQYTKSSKLNK